MIPFLFSVFVHHGPAVYCNFPIPFSLVSRACRLARSFPWPHGSECQTVTMIDKTMLFEMGNLTRLACENSIFGWSWAGIDSTRVSHNIIYRSVCSEHYVYDPCNAYGSSCTSAEGLRSLALVGNKQTMKTSCYHVPFSSHFFESLNSLHS